jgi:hypothetical protein
VWGAQRGLEVWSWVVADAPPPIAPVLFASEYQPPEGTPEEPAPERLRYTIVDNRLSIREALAVYAQRPVPLPAGERLRWQAAGLRVVAVPVTDLPSIQASLRLVGPTQRQWLGEVPAWTDLVGTALPRARTVAIGTGDAHLEGGRLRLLARAWIAPQYNGGPDALPRATLRLEMVPQHERQLTEPQRLLAASAPGGRLEAQGRVFAALGLGVYLGGEEALVIVPDAPESDWGQGESTEDAVESGSGITLGEAMLTAGSPTRTRAVLVLIPHVPQRYELRREQ